MNTPQLYNLFLEVEQKVSTDTRKLIPGSLFFALRGESFNGNEFASEAIQKGAAFAIIDQPEYQKDDRYIVVSDVLLVMQELARHHRNRLSIPVLGLTGSNGKTTSKELVHAVLSKKFKCLSTQGNLNNHIGVPLTILAIDSSVEIAVVEMGANHVGEIAQLCSIANPTHGYITNIGKAHIGTFGGFDNIVRGKSELYHHLIATSGTVFINSKNPILMNMSKRFNNPVLYPGKDDYYHCELISADPFVKLMTEDGSEVQSQLLGAYNFENIATALCVGKYFQVPAAEAHDAIRFYVPSNMRSQVIHRNSNTIILDAYNANPSSMTAAVENLAAMKAERKVLIVGDMFELEDEAEGEHRALGQLIRDNGFTEVLLCGELMRFAAEEFDAARYFTTKQALEKYLRDNPIKNATVLIKASRGIKLESVIDYL